MAEFRSALDLMHARVNECHAATCSIPRLVAEQGAFVGPAMDAGMAQALHVSMGVVAGLGGAACFFARCCGLLEPAVASHRQQWLFCSGWL